MPTQLHPLLGSDTLPFFKKGQQMISTQFLPALVLPDSHPAPIHGTFVTYLSVARLPATHTHEYRWPSSLPLVHLLTELCVPLPNPLWAAHCAEKEKPFA